MDGTIYDNGSLARLALDGTADEQRTPVASPAFVDRVGRTPKDASRIAVICNPRSHGVKTRGLDVPSGVDVLTPRTRADLRRTLADFKAIFFWEWFHRLMGRAIGLAFALPLAFAWVRGWIPQGYRSRLIALLGLGGLQGVFGWLMVRSGLGGEMTDVSHFWLSIHLCTALITLAGLVWTALDLHALDRDSAARPAILRPLAIGASLGLFVQVLLGAWVAGLNAGLASDTWPLMQGRILPEANMSRGLFWAVTQDPFLLHFLHRWFAWIAFATLLALGWKALARENNAGKALIGLATGQVLLGIVTVISGVSLWIAVGHQVTGALLVAATAASAHAIGGRGPATRA